ncbi:MAG: single-stranded-DNA-specific exonuclease RecJ [Fusobacteriaceae bacterium]
MKWEYSPKLDLDINFLCKKTNISPFLMTLLLNRGIKTSEDIKQFLFPELSSFRNPFDFENMEEVVKKIIHIKNKKSKIFIYGDYDVDGITSAVFLTKVFQEIGIDTDYYIPNRMEEDYGLDRKNLDYMKSEGAELVITVDTSISSLEDIRYGKNIGIDVIITDHHKSAKATEDDEVLYINPKLSGNYKFKFLAGAGVAFKVAQAVYMNLGIELNHLYKYLDIVMIGTVADVVPIVDENRIIIKEGLKRLKNTKNKGLISLIRYLKFQNKNINTTDISYFISPLINSLGRIGISRIGANFFTETDESKIYEIIEEMKKSNKKRRELEHNIYEEASSMIEDILKKTSSIKCLFLSSHNWHSGVIGIVSSRLCIKYNLPVVLVSLHEGLGKASSRSIQGINVFNIFKDMSPLLIRFGGHDLAAGFIAKESNLKEIKKFFLSSIEKTDIIKEEKLLKIDMEFPLEKITEKTLRDIELLSPFGGTNNHPIFTDKNLIFEDIKKFGINNKHFSGYIIKHKKKYSVVGFDMSKYINDNGYLIQKFDIAYYPEKNHHKGEDSIQIKIKDIKIIDEFCNVFLT